MSTAPVTDAADGSRFDVVDPLGGNVIADAPAGGQA